jgi:DNA-binding beta-propeller fold protein YncE
MYVSDLRSGAVGEFRRSDGAFLGWVLPSLDWGDDAVAARFSQSVRNGSSSRSQTAKQTTRQPLGLCLSPDETVLAVADKRNSCVVLLQLDGSGAFTTIGSLGTGDGQLSIPVSVDFMPDGRHVVVADEGKLRLQVLATDGGGATAYSFTNLRLADPARAVCVDGNGNIVLATTSDFSNGRVQVFSGVDGSKLLDKVGGVELRACSPSGLALDRHTGQLAVIDCLEKIDTAQQTLKEGTRVVLI